MRNPAFIAREVRTLMPLYEYQCGKCNHRFEKIQKFSDPGPDVCPVCGEGPVTRLPSSPAIQFKGTGWYITDYAKKSGTDAGKTERTEKSEKSEKGDSAKSDTAAKSDSGTAASTDSSSTASPAATKDTKSSSGD
jgi:putative FmdB family regulatory protein